jgi:outer membrane protein assembly factor BamD
MAFKRSWFSRTALIPTVLALTVCLPVSSFARRKKYENPITKDTQQPDKVLFDKAINDIEKGRYEVARITLNTLINTYDTSEYLAKAKLAIADSWFREGGAHGLAQAEAEYKDFILFYPTMEEAAESQNRICDIHYRQMEKADRDPSQALRADAECRQLLVQFPNSKFAPIAEQKLRNIQEALADGEMRVGQYYFKKGSLPAAANRLSGLVDQYPLYSGADEALWYQGDAYGRMGPRFRQKSGEAYQRIVRDYPLSSYSDAAKKRLKEMELPIPEADPVALNRMKYELENRSRESIFASSLGLLKRGPDVHTAAKSGTPAMAPARLQIPVSVPTPVATSGLGNDVGIEQVKDGTALDTGKEARSALPAAAADGTKAEAPAAQPQPLPTNAQYKLKPKKLKKTKKQPEVNAPAPTPAANPTGVVNPGTAASDAAKPDAAKP